MELQRYDSVQSGDACERGAANLYVIDGAGHIYAGGKTTKHFKHSSFLAGGATLAAGTMKVVQGRIKFVTRRSGHYLPEVQQMLNLLERLRACGVDLTEVTVYRENVESTMECRERHAKQRTVRRDRVAATAALAERGSRSAYDDGSGAAVCRRVSRPQRDPWVITVNSSDKPAFSAERRDLIIWRP